MVIFPHAGVGVEGADLDVFFWVVVQNVDTPVFVGMLGYECCADDVHV